MLQNVKKAAIPLIVVGLLVAAVFAYWYFYQKDLLITGVPYNGNFAGTIIGTAPQSVVAMITRYWGDERVSLTDIRYRLFRFGTPHSNVETVIKLTDYASFFSKSGYETTIERFRTVADFRKYLRRDIPLIFALKLPSDRYAFIDHSVLIGVLPSKKSVILHSNLLGNNYEMPFSDFEKSWVGREQDKVFLAVRPSPSILSVIRGPSHNVPYPKRLDIMDSEPMQKLRFKIRYTDEFSSKENTANLFEEIIADPAFQNIRPMGRVYIYVRLGQEYAAGGDPNKAIETVIKYALPLNHDLEKSFGEWPEIKGGVQKFEWDVPWKVLGDFYFQKGDLQDAKKHYLKAAALAPENAFTQKKLQLIDEILEEEK